MESFLIWIATFILIVIIILPYFLKFRKKQKQDEEKRLEAVRLGADKAIAQHPQIDPYTCIGCGACVAACPEGQVLGIVTGKAVIINGLKCVGHGKCAEACPVEGITIGLGDLSHREDIPFMTQNNETNIPGIYIAGELGGLSLIKNAINQGSMVVDHIASKLTERGLNDIFDLIIVGAGPAGLSAALASHKHNLKYLLIDQQDAGGTVLQYPRKKVVMTKPVALPLYGLLKQPEYSKEELLDIWQNVQNNYSLNIRTGEKLVTVKRFNNHFKVSTDKNEYNAQKVILALGRRGTPRKLGVPGEEKPKVMYKLIDAESYQNEHLLVVGGGDSAIEAAMGLARQPGNVVSLSYRKEKFFRIKTRNQERLTELIHNNKIAVYLNSGVTDIGDKIVRMQTRDGTLELPNDYTFIFAGGEPPFKLLKQIGIRFGGETEP